MHLFLTFLCFLLSISCSSNRKLSSHEQQTHLKKTYTNISKLDLINGAIQVLTLMDKNDIKINPTENGFVASRDWFMYRVVHASNGTDYWVFEIEEKGNELIASIKPTVRFGLVESDQKGTMIQGTALYDLFWSRLDYTVGKSEHWPTCQDGLMKMKSNETWGSLEHICDSITLADEAPSDISMKRLPAAI